RKGSPTSRSMRTPRRRRLRFRATGRTSSVASRTTGKGSTWRRRWRRMPRGTSACDCCRRGSRPRAAASGGARGFAPPFRWRTDVAVRVLIADDHALIRESFRALLERRGYEVAGEAVNGQDAVRLARELKPDVALI